MALTHLSTDADVEAQEERLLAEAVSGWADKYPEVTVRRTLIRGTATRSLLDASAGASMLVVGAVASVASPNCCSAPWD